VVGRTIGSVSGAKLRAFALLGHGAKALLWYNHGPEPYFQKFSWGDNEAAYPAIAQTNALIGSAENVLYPGQAGNAKIALFLPRSAYFWGARDTDPYWGKDLKGIYYALTHAHYPVDFVDEDGIASGELTTRGYKLLYVTAPNLPGPAAAALHDWVRTGGTAVFSDIYAGGADEYDETSHALDDLRGVAPTPRAGAGDSPITGPLPVVHGPVVFVNPTYGTGSVRGEVAPEPLPVTTAQVLANYGGGGAAIARQTYGAGQTFTYGFRLGSSYLLTGKETPGGLPQGWDAEWRSMAVEPAYIVARDKPVDVDVDLVEAVRLESAAGIAVTLLNWTGQPLDHVTVTVHHAGNVNSARLADGGTVPVTRNGDDVTVTLPLRDVNVLMLRP